ncbi:MAG: RluA family pseudouridine synthase [Dethiobacter sp.]|nr:RluA family pseudouridine synthase [Dethiobacter sp.]
MTSRVVDDSLAGERLDVIVARLAGLSRARAQKLLAEGLVTVDGLQRKANYRAVAGERLEMVIPPLRVPEILPEDILLEILHEDEDVLVLNKPQGLVVHPAAGHSSGTLVNALLHHCPVLSGVGGYARPGIIHRLDKDTSGVLVVTKSDRAHLFLAGQFKEHSVTREYVAIVHGNMAAEQGVIDAPIARHPRERKKMAVAAPGSGRRAVTRYRVLERFDAFMLLALRLETGRTHQIRVHLAAIGHPVVNDPVYGPKKSKLRADCRPVRAGESGGQALHARLLGFRHPADGRYVDFSAEPPQEFRQLLSELRRKKAGGAAHASQKADYGCGDNPPRPDQNRP